MLYHLAPARSADLSSCLRKGIALAWVLALAATTAQAGNEAHVHGEARLMLALENETLEVRLESPAADIVGFEHRASSDAQKTKLEQARRQLENPVAWLQVENRSCELLSTSVDLSMLEPVPDYDDTEKGEHEHRHEHHHDKHGAEQQHHDPDHNQDAANDGSHNEVSASYRYRCTPANREIALEVQLFSAFPSLHKISTQWVSDSKQGSASLKPGSHRIIIR